MTSTILRSRRGVAAALALLLATLQPMVARVPAHAQRAQTAQITVFAAASLKTALDSIAADYEQNTGGKLAVSYAASSTLAKQIEQGAPADIFISADLDWMDYLAKKTLIKTGSKTNLLGNRLVLIASASFKATLPIGKNFALADALGAGKLAMADVAAVPAGKYGKAALEALGVWSSVEPKVAQVENVRAALALVARDEAPLGIVYQTDATAEPKVRIVDIFPDDTHPPIVYPLAITAASDKPALAAAFIAYLGTTDAKARFTAQGFTVLK